MKFYSYLWLREDGTPYYAGKGSGKRGLQSLGHLTKRPKNRSDILLFYHPTEAEAFESEKAFIKWFGRKDLGTGCLHNFTDGGDDGYKRKPWTLERRAAQSERAKKQGIGGWNKGMKNPAQSERNKGNTYTKGKHTHTPEGNRRISESKKGIPLSKEHCQKLSESHKGRPWSAAQRAACERKKDERFLKTVVW